MRWCILSSCISAINEDNAMLTDEVPLSARLVCADVNGIWSGGQVDLAAVVSPRSELHGAELVVEGEPLDVNGAWRDVQTKRNPGTGSIRVDDYVRRIHAVDVLVSTARDRKRLIQCRCSWSNEVNNTKRPATLFCVIYAMHMLICNVILIGGVIWNLFEPTYSRYIRCMRNRQAHYKCECYFFLDSSNRLLLNYSKTQLIWLGSSR